MIRRKNLSSDYGADNPEPQQFKDSAKVRGEAADGLDAAIEYIGGHSSTAPENYQP